MEQIQLSNNKLLMMGIYVLENVIIVLLELAL